MSYSMHTHISYIFICMQHTYETLQRRMCVSSSSEDWRGKHRLHQFGWWWVLRLRGLFATPVAVIASGVTPPRILIGWVRALLVASVEKLFLPGESRFVGWFWTRFVVFFLTEHETFFGV